MKPFWEITPEEVKKCLKRPRWHPRSVEYFRGGGWSSAFLTRGGMPVTMVRINLVRAWGRCCRSPRARPSTLPRAVHDVLDRPHQSHLADHLVCAAVTGKGAFRDVYAVMNNWGANHGAFSYGHIGADLITLASMLRIPVYMHNVPEEPSIGPAPGPPLARLTWKAPIFAPALTWVRSTCRYR